MLENFEDIPVLNPVAVIDKETTAPSTSSATEDLIAAPLPSHLPASKNNAVTSNTTSILQ